MMCHAKAQPRPGRVLIRGVNWLGDAVMTTPALQRLRQALPNSHLTLLVPEKLADLWKEHPSIDTLVTFSQFNTSAPPAAARPAELEFRGTKGTLYFQSNGFEVVPDALPDIEFPAFSPLTREQDRKYRANAKPAIEPRKTSPNHNDTVLHARNFLDCIKSRKPCNCDIETGHRSTTPTLLANIAHQTKSLLEWDAAAEQVTNSPAANKLLSYEYRPPYSLPSI